MEKRFQVFVSSTFQDLQKERQEVMQALLELDCIPSGMELFPAANESQWSLIKKVIDDCDYYILILAGRYGTIGPDGLSYTEMEYRYAISSGKPIIGFVHKDPDSISAKHTEQSADGKQKLSAFRDLVQTKLCKHWSTPVELGSVVSRSLIHLIKTSPAIGWVRADELPDRDATIELLRLRKQVDELTSELQRSRTSAPKGAEELAQGTDKVMLRYNFYGQQNEYQTKKGYAASIDSTWNDIFAALAPQMINEASEADLQSQLTLFVQGLAVPQLRQRDQTKALILSSFGVNDSDFQTVKVQLRALGLMTRSERSRSVKDNSTYWSLTPYGDDLMTRLRAVRRPNIHEPEDTAA